jgi:hypothetical protein
MYSVTNIFLLFQMLATTVRSESRCALSLCCVDLVVIIEVAIEVCLMS